MFWWFALIWSLAISPLEPHPTPVLSVFHHEADVVDLPILVVEISSLAQYHSSWILALVLMRYWIEIAPWIFGSKHLSFSLFALFIVHVYYEFAFSYFYATIIFMLLVWIEVAPWILLRIFCSKHLSFLYALVIVHVSHPYVVVSSILHYAFAFSYCNAAHHLCC